MASGFIKLSTIIMVLNIFMYLGVNFAMNAEGTSGLNDNYNFYFKRDIKKEKEIYYDILGLKDNEEYIFLHDDPVRDFIIDRKHINPNIKIIHLVELEDISILDTLYLVEKSKEVHMYTTGLASFIDQMGIKHNSLKFTPVYQVSTNRPANIIVGLEYN